MRFRFVMRWLRLCGPVALYIGDLACAEESVAMLLGNARERGLAGWIARGRCFLGMVMIAQGNFAAGLPLLRDALAELHENGAAPSHPAFLAALAEGFGRSGEVIEGLRTIDQALVLSRSHEEHWCLPELLRVKGELAILGGAADADAASAGFFCRPSIALADKRRSPGNCAQQRVLGVSGGIGIASSRPVNFSIE